MTSDACLPAVRASPKSRLRPNDILYFRYWLIVQGWTVFERSVANPDTLADLPVIQAAAAGAVGIECEAVRSITLEVYRAATSEQTPGGRVHDWTPGAGRRLGRLRRPGRDAAAAASPDRTVLARCVTRTGTARSGAAALPTA
jgi:hypothetical protein